MSVSFCRKRRLAGDPAALERVELTDQFREDFEQIADDPIVPDFEQGRLRVDVDHQDLVRLLHSRQMLDPAADPHGDVLFRPYRHPRLTDLQGLRDPTAVDGLSGSRDRPPKAVREVLEQLEVLRVSEAVAAAHDDVRLLRSQAAFLGELIELEELCIEVLRRQLHPFVDDLAAAVRIVRRRHEHVPPDRGHLRPVLLAQDVGQALPSEARSDHVEVAFRVDVELHAVRGEPGLQDRMEPPSEVPSVLRSSEEDDLRLLPPDQLGHHLRVRPRTVDLQHRIGHDDHTVEAVPDRSFCKRVDAVAGQDPGEGRSPEIGESSSFADQLRAHVAEPARPSLQEHPDPVEMRLVLEHMAVRHGTTTRSRIRAARRARTDSFASPEKIRPARGGSRIVSTLATIVGELSSPTFFGSIPTSAQDQWTITPPRFTRIFPVNVGERGLLHPKFTVHREGMSVCHHSVPSSAVRRARTLPPTIWTSDTYVIWGRSRWPAIPGPT